MTSAALDPEAVHVLPMLAVQCDVETEPDAEAIGEAMVRTMGKLAGYIAEHGLQHAGPPRSLYTSYGEDRVQMTVGFPIVEPDVEPPATAEVSLGELAHGPALRFTHTGPYERLRDTYDAITRWMIDHDLMASEADWERFTPMWEEYVGDPVNTAPDELVTYIYLSTPPETLRILRDGRTEEAPPAE